jgi:DNA polymerase sigma
MGTNQESVAQLWLAFLVYYTEIFNFEEHIIQIHMKSCVTRFSKLWLTDTLIAIQDPFDHTHNLGAGLSRRSKLCQFDKTHGKQRKY